MKKVFMFSVPVAIALLSLLSGCNKHVCEAPYEWNFIVENKTDKEIVVSYHPEYSEGYYYNYGYGGYGEYSDEDISIVIAPTESKAVIELQTFGGCNNKVALEDAFEAEEILPFGMTHMSDDFWDILGTKVTVDGKEIPRSVWLRKHWTFAGEPYARNYTLTVTDELLAKLAAEQPATEQ